jgi:hypothetical protein
MIPHILSGYILYRETAISDISGIYPRNQRRYTDKYTGSGTITYNLDLEM